MVEVTKLEESKFEQLQAELREKWNNAILTKSGNHKRHVVYGDALSQKPSESACLIYVCGIPFSAVSLCEELFDAFDECSKRLGVKTNVMVQNNLQDRIEQWKQAYHALSFHLEREEVMVSLLAQSEKILVLGILPAYFTLRENQHVTQLCTGLHERVQEGVLVRTLTSRLLNTSAVVVSSDEEECFLREICRLTGLYQGTVRRLESEDEAVLAQAVCKYVLEGQDGRLDEVDMRVEKRRAVIYCRTYEKDYWRITRQVIGATDLSSWDITLVVPGGIDDTRICKDIDLLPAQVRVISREPTFPCGAQDYVSLQVALSSYGGYDSFNAWFESLDKSIAKLEARRLLGSARFDVFVYIGELSSLWGYIASGIDAGVKRKIELADFSKRAEEKQKKNGLAFGMELQADEALFDEVCFVSEELYKRALEVSPGLACRLLDFPVDSQHAYLKFELRRDVSWGDSARYLVAQFESESMGLGTLVEVPTSAEGDEAYLVEGTEDDLLDCLKAIEKTSPDARWSAMVFEEQSSKTQKSIHRLYASHVKLIEDSRCLGLYTIRAYLELFTGVVVPRADSRSCLRIAADVYKLPVYYPTDGGLARAEETTFTSFEEVERYLADQCELLYGAEHATQGIE